MREYTQAPCFGCSYAGRGLGRTSVHFRTGWCRATTKAFDEAGSRVSRQLLSQSPVNLLDDIAVFVGLSFLHVPHPLVWATLAAAGPLGLLMATPLTRHLCR